MKRYICAVVLLLSLLMTGCESTASNAPVITVTLVDTEGCFIPANGQLVHPGEDVCFELVLEEGYAFAATDYYGNYRFEIKNGKQCLSLFNVRYPARVNLFLTDRYRTVCYFPNGGLGASFSQTYDITYHLRPNSAIGTDVYSNPEHTLLCWNTEPDGSGTRVGLGSRVSVLPDVPLELYAQWVPWSNPEDFTYTLDDGVTITGYRGNDEILAVPEYLGGEPVRSIASGAFVNCGAKSVVLPKSLETVEEGAFQGCALQELTLFDNIVSVGAAGFSDCPDFATLHINAIEPPFGYGYRRESCFADKVDILMEASGQRKVVFYGGCSMWYNLDSQYARYMLEDRYRVINMGLNGTVNSAVQLQIISKYLEPGDVFFHTPELSSHTQLLNRVDFGPDDRKLWCGLENNYDLLTCLDLRQFPSLLNSFCQWLELKTEAATYADHYVDTDGHAYLDEQGGIPFERKPGIFPLIDGVWLDPDYLTAEGMERLAEYYRQLADRGVVVYVSYACVNMDAVPESQKGNVSVMDAAFRSAIDKMEGATLISDLQDYLYEDKDFYDTNYHLVSEAAMENTRLWLRDLRAQLEQDGLWE